MKRARQITILDRLVDLRKRGQHQLVSDRVEHLPVETWTSRQVFDREIEALFSGQPQVVGHVDSVRQPGSYMIAGPYVIVRGNDRILRGFYNTCRHRGATLVSKECDKPMQSFTCRFHGWRYGLDGTLRHIPRDFAFPSLDMADHALKPVPVTENCGLVWTGPMEDHDAGLGVLAEDLLELGLERYVSHDKVVVEKKANWKLLMAVNMEFYHLRTVHPRAFAKGSRDLVMTYDEVEPHFLLIGGQENLVDSVGLPEDERDLFKFAKLLYVLFPNTLMLVSSKAISLNHFRPLAPDCTVWTHEMLYLPEHFTGDRGRKELSNFFEYYNYVFESEDYGIAESVQENLSNGVNETHVLGREEGMVKAFHKMVHARVTETTD